MGLPEKRKLLMHFNPRLLPLGDSSLLIQLGEEIDLTVNQSIHALASLIEGSSIPGILETVPAYATLLVHYDPQILSFSQMQKYLRTKIHLVEEIFNRKRRLIEVLVRYGGKYGIDLESVAAELKLSVEEVVRLHSETIYTVYMMGFTPGFPYMGKLAETLVMPRLETPRTRVPAGTVAIAGSQTGIYSIDSPGGWRLIGWTPLKLFDPESNTPFLFAPGDEVKFQVMSA